MQFTKRTRCSWGRRTARTQAGSWRLLARLSVARRASMGGAVPALRLKYGCGWILQYEVSETLQRNYRRDNLHADPAIGPYTRHIHFCNRFIQSQEETLPLPFLTLPLLSLDSFLLAFSALTRFSTRFFCSSVVSDLIPAQCPVRGPGGVGKGLKKDQQGKTNSTRESFKEWKIAQRKRLLWESKGRLSGVLHLLRST